MDMMNAMQIEQCGGIEVFKKTRVNKPAIKAGHILIKVKASSVNPLDCKIRQGDLRFDMQFPFIPHGDVAGVVAEVGSGVSRFKVGDEVYGCAGGVGSLQGALAEYMLADADLIALKPKQCSMLEAAALPLVSLTAWQAMYDRAQVRAKQQVLIYGATGGVGHIAVQLASAKNAVVTAMVGDNDKFSLAKRLGAEHCVNYKSSTVSDFVSQFTKGEGYDVVFDTVGGNVLTQAFEAAKINSVIVSILPAGSHDLTPFFCKNLTLAAVFQPLPLLTGVNRKHYGEILTEIAKLVDQGKVKPLIDSQSFTFTQVGQAHQHLEQGKAIGKVVLSNDLV